jgi:hypothetical protein
MRWQYTLGRAAGLWQRVRPRLRWQYLKGYAAGLRGRFTGR